MRRGLPACLTLLLLLTACTEPADPPASTRTSVESPRPVEPLELVSFEDGYGSTRTGLRGCASVSDDEDAAYSLPVLVWVRLRVTERVRVFPAVYAERSNSIDRVVQYLGPDPGPDAPHVAVSIAPAGAGPSRNRQTYDTHLIGDVRDSAAGLAAARRSWDSRVELDDGGQRLDPGDHYLFVEIDPAKGGMDLHGLTASWTRAEEEGRTPIGSLSLRVQCGG